MPDAKDRNYPELPPWLRARARGAGSNAVGRYEKYASEAEADGWDIPEDERLLPTDVALESPRSAISYNTSPDLPFDRSINPYRGCEHGCIYCFARPSHAWLGLSPGLDFETKLVARPGIGAVLARELRAKSYKPAVIAIGTNTDPYQPIERTHRAMRGVLEVLRDFRHPVAIVTKGTLVERDIDILSGMALDGLVKVGVSVTSLDPVISRAMEPRAPAPARRLEMIRRLSAAGIPVRAMIAPVIPALTDHEVERIVEAAAKAGAGQASLILLRLPREVSGLFRDWLTEHFPDRAARIMGRVRELHGGRDYDPEWGRRFTGQGEWAVLMRQRFTLAVRRFGLNQPDQPLRLDLFKPPARDTGQLSLF